MNREERRAERKAQGQKTKQTPQTITKQRGTATTPRRPFALWTIGLLVAVAVLFGLWGVNAATVATAKEKAATAPAPVQVASLDAAPALAAPAASVIPASFGSTPAPSAPASLDTPSGDYHTTAAKDLKAGQKVWYKGEWRTVASVKTEPAHTVTEYQTVPVTAEEAATPKRVIKTETIGNNIRLLLEDKQGKRYVMEAPKGTPVDTIPAQRVSVAKDGATDDYPTTGIQNVQAGNKVISRDPVTGKTSVRTVTRTFKRTAYELVKGEFADAVTGKVVETIKGTPEHPFFVEGGGMVAMGQLGIGTKVLVRAGPALVVKSITHESHPEGVAVYNFEVEGDHTYFVGKANGGIWVHNQCVLGKGTLAGDMAGTGFKPGQYRVSAPKVNSMMDAMRKDPVGFWKNMGEPILVDEHGVITSGHHRIVAAKLSGTPIPEGIIQRGTTYRGPAIDWSNVWVLPH